MNLILFTKYIHTYTFSQTSIDTRYIDTFVHTYVLIHSHDNYMKITIHYQSTHTHTQINSCIIYIGVPKLLVLLVPISPKKNRKFEIHLFKNSSF